MEITLKNGNVVIYNNSKDLTLKCGATLKSASVSLDTTLKALRDANTTTDASGKIITTCDLNFKSESAAASFIQGASTNGKRYFSKYLGTTYTPSSTKVATSATTTTTTSPSTSTEVEKSKNVDQNKLIENIICFCKDFAYKPDNRVLNNMLYIENVNDYLLSFMELTNFDEDLLALANNKFKSSEWKNILNTLKSITPTRERNNKRLVIKYGSAGTGKTYDAEQELIKNGFNVIKIVGSATADPDDLFTRFDPNKKDYVLTELGQAMTEGHPIIIDEANLYSQVVLARLQSAVDNSNSITDRGITLNIKDGFKVIITMNLETNLGKTPLPDPLVSRAVEIENYDKREKRTFNIW